MYFPIQSVAFQGANNSGELILKIYKIVCSRQSKKLVQLVLNYNARNFIVLPYSITTFNEGALQYYVLFCLFVFQLPLYFLCKRIPAKYEKYLIVDSTY